LLWFESDLVRFGTCGTLIALYGIANGFARRREALLHPDRAKLPLWLKLCFTASVLGFYLLIGPTGGPLLGGAGNVAGVALAVAAMAARVRGVGRSRWGLPHDAAARMMFYFALPAAVGTPWGWLALTLPACAASLFHFARVRARAGAASAAATPQQPHC
jgi:hypothetical protein